MNTSIGSTHAACQGEGDLTTSETTNNLGHRRPTNFTPALPGRYQAGTTFGTRPVQRPLTGGEN